MKRRADRGATTSRTPTPRSRRCSSSWAWARSTSCWSAIPEALRLAHGLDLAPGASEFDVLADLEAMAGRNRRAGPDLVCFAGGGAYDHEIPAAVRRLAFRSEFVTAYTPYQPEVAQGVLQALFEYQTLLCRLSGVEVANASLYDGASACVEAVNLAVAAAGRPTVWVSEGVHPHWREVVRDVRRGHRPRAGRRCPCATASPRCPTTRRASAPAAILVQYPNYLGCLEDLAAAAGWPRRAAPCCSSPSTRSPPACCGRPARYGADVVVGEGQPFGTPLSLGGPYLGLFACRLEHVRRLPGRLVGETVDTEGRRAYVTTLRTREQDIRREKASSNVCTNQTLIAVCCAIQLSWLGTTGLRELALRCARATRYTPRGAARARRRGAARGRAGAARVRGAHARARRRARRPHGRARVSSPGVALGDEYGGGLLVAVTERRTRAEIDAYAAAFEKVADVSPRVPYRPTQPSEVGCRRARQARRASSSAPLMGRDEEPTVFELSVPDRRAWSFRDDRPARVGRGRAGARRAPRPGARRRWPRCPSAISSPTSRASRTGSTRSTSAPTRWAPAR